LKFVKFAQKLKEFVQRICGLWQLTRSSCSLTNAHRVTNQQQAKVRKVLLRVE
jgi:hypothetical protein